MSQEDQAQAFECTNCQESGATRWDFTRNVGPFCEQCWAWLQESFKKSLGVAALEAENQRECAEHLERIAKIEAENQQLKAHYEAALFNWNDTLKRKAELEAEITALRQQLADYKSHP